MEPGGNLRDRTGQRITSSDDNVVNTTLDVRLLRRANQRHLSICKIPRTFDLGWHFKREKSIVEVHIVQGTGAPRAFSFETQNIGKTLWESWRNIDMNL